VETGSSLKIDIWYSLLGLVSSWTMTGICWISLKISLGLWKFMVHQVIPWSSAFTWMSSHSVAWYFFQLCCLWFSLCRYTWSYCFFQEL
jgi:hypothetical protein